MPKKRKGRKGTKPPGVNPKDMGPPKIEEGNGGKKHNGHRFYSVAEQEEIWKRLEGVIGAEFWIQEVMQQMSARGISPIPFIKTRHGKPDPSDPTPSQLISLRQRLSKLGIYPPPVESKHNEHRECWCTGCRAKKSFPFYYVRNGISFQDHLERRQIALEEIEDESLREELMRLEGESPGVVVEMKNKMRERKTDGKAA